MNTKITFALALFSIFFSSGFSQNVSLDNEFGINGKVITSVASTGGLGISGIAIQPNGKIVVCGGNLLYGDFIALTRYNSDGSIDDSFGLNGSVATPLTYYYGGIGNVVRLLEDGKIIVGGLYGSPTVLNSFDFGLCRYNSNGSLDASFGNSGVVSTDFFGLNDFANSVEIQTDHKIVVSGTAGVTGPGNTYDFAVARYDIDGNPDSSFGTNGKTTYNFGYSYNAIESTDAINGTKFQSDGKIIAAGYTTRDNGSVGVASFGLIRLNQNGLLDTSFGEQGVVKTDFEPNHISMINSLVLTPQDEIIAVGTMRQIGVNSVSTIATKYDAEGNIDLNFGVQGKVNTMINDQNTIINEIRLLNDGKIIGCGYVSSGLGNQDFLLMRYDANGVLDLNFNNDGYVTTDFANSSDVGRAIALQPDGKILCGGDISNPYRYGLARYNSSNLGTNDFLNPSFNVYPIPFENYLNVDFEIKCAELVTINMVDGFGRLIMQSIKKPLLAGKQSLQLNFSGISNGFYFVKITFGNHEQIIKVVK